MHFVEWDQDFSRITQALEVRAIYAPNQYRVRFIDDITDEVLKEETVPHGQRATPPELTDKEGYVFLGWSADTDEVVADIDVRALYTPKELTVFFVDWDGAVLKTEVVDYSQSATSPQDPTREGHRFTGWDPSYENITQSVIVRAQYQVNQYTVRFFTHDAQLIEAQEVDYGQPATAPEPPE